MPRIAQGKSISIRSGRYRVQKSYLAHRCVQRDVSAFRSQENRTSKLCDFTTSIATICVCHASDRATQIHQHSERALTPAEIIFSAPLRAGRRLSFPLAGKPHIKVCDFTSIATICVCHASDRARQIHQHSERTLTTAEILFGAPLRAARRLSFPLAGKPHIKVCDFTSIATICVCHASDRATQIHQHSERALTPAEIIFSAPLRAGRRLSFPLAGKPHIKVCDFTSIATICVCHASDRARQIHQHSERTLTTAEILFGAPLRAARRLSFPLAGKPHIEAL